MMEEMKMDEVINYLNNSSDESKVYIGCDSEVVRSRRVKGTKVRYTTVIVVHIDGNKGGKVFGKFHHDEVPNKGSYIKKPKYRLMNEVYKVSELYLELSELIDRDIEVHLDLNPDERYVSSAVVKQALGYVKGVCGVDAKLKPDAWAASACADRWHSVHLK